MSLQVDVIEAEIMSYLDAGKKVYIESGAANDEICSYHVEKREIYMHGSVFEDKTVTFQTSACIFPPSISLHNYSNVDCEDFKGALFVSVW